MKILFLACLSPKTGNNTTAERIRSHIEKAGHTCELRDAREFQSSAEVAELLSRHHFQSALGIHLFKAGRFLLDIQIPFGIIFGGTDINEDVKVEQKRVVMEQVLLKARFAVAFTEELKKEAEVFMLSQSSKIYVQPQGVQTDVSDSFSWTEFLKSAGLHTEHVNDLRVFLLVCGLRRVKDPLYLADDFSEWHCDDPLNVLIIIGPKVDPVFTVEVEDVVHRTAGISVALERSQQELHAAMKRCFAVVNSSVSEGMSAAILEAMDLGVPVLARNIPGNASIVQHEFNGLLYSSPQEFVHQSQRLVSDRELRERLVRNGKLYVEEHHNLKRERETYQQLVDTLLTE
ncbi:glycosyltransferase 1 domain-containing protein 1 isoform X1 [Takifugu rubripes]|uniref:Glycosyltransferase 1 domain containing 1 n=1 Tax=Takifugu rubripes TaxID=31033 RepID=A0A674MPE7_TAKRU|nr:glycosyltransferase 1 domain-containing protein 1 isoform X1 [Takifugu rubripes]XP_056889777.1 glycosyltransferase 1 domain-containing protein 1 isoform X1 [Takifugu flavidus]|eukprot:XP_011613512.1 PREDICTED: glycosyltransferase 1 domain-containing protein 1 isoform X1 [Takifugu rubripes]